MKKEMMKRRFAALVLATFPLLPHPAAAELTPFGMIEKIAPVVVEAADRFGHEARLGEYPLVCTYTSSYIDDRGRNHGETCVVSQDGHIVDLFYGLNPESCAQLCADPKEEGKYLEFRWKAAVETCLHKLNEVCAAQE